MRDGFAIGLLATPALEGGGPWFMPAVRVSAPLGVRHGLDFEAGHILGGTSKYAVIRTFLAGQLRFTRKPTGVHVDERYWLAGLKYLKRTKLDGQGTVLRYDPDTALSIGHGWKHTFQNGARALGEVGLGGGEGFMVYVSAGVQWGFPPHKSPQQVSSLQGLEYRHRP